MPESVAREMLPPAIIEKWGGDVYPRNYWDGRGSQRSFEQVAARAYREACQVYEKLLRNEKVREIMHQYRMPTVVRNTSSAHVIETEKHKTATTVECHVWGSSMDIHPTRLNQYPGPPPKQGAQHGHHATYIANINHMMELIKANSWRPFAALLEAKQKGMIDLDVQEWGDDGFKTWDMSAAHPAMMRDPKTTSLAFSNMTISKKPKSRFVDLNGRTII